MSKSISWQHQSFAKSENKPSVRIKFLEKLFEVIDQMDSVTFANFFKKTASFRFANHPASYGREAIAQTAQMLFDELQKIEHQVFRSWNLGNHLLVEGLVIYTRKKDSKRLEIPFLSVFEFDSDHDDEIAHYRAYIDATSLFLD